ncbi:MAG: tRNA uridine-5-carboxymethylaminomethyl(34) synthesis GTPase MnmE [Bacteroidales bacterium]|nr:tRNA uridine-5-carboxymethylaminomethyl(34) synthesis GTPase MnmE [Bacteroidales bacterium]
MNDTICALSTAPGVGAIAVIRLSGPASFATIGQLFKSSEKNLEIAAIKSHTIHHGVIGDGMSILDEVLISCFRAPHSYTGEDVIEISCHGSDYIQKKILELLISAGLRLAKPGEFTFRAFMNKKFDLSQAEAVADLIASHSGTSHELALKQMRGGFSKKIGALRESLIEFTSLIELELDFSEEHMIFADRADLRTLLDHIETELTQLIKSFSLGNVIKNGIPVAIIGKPNVGKSTLLNAILNEEKAIVSELPGTTRDAIEDTIVIGGYSFRFIDTAGLRASEEVIENIGIGRTWEKISEASIILYVFDVTEQSFADVKEAISELKKPGEVPPLNLVLVGNKTDLLDQLPRGFKEFVEYETIFVSGKRKENLHLLVEHLVDVVGKAKTTDKTIVSNSRHYEALQQAHNAILAVRTGLSESISPDLLTVDIHKALYHLGEITGEITTDEILGAIFGRFCVGK